jgi:hypothetical protein
MIFERAGLKAGAAAPIATGADVAQPLRPAASI